MMGPGTDPGGSSLAKMSRGGSRPEKSLFEAGIADLRVNRIEASQLSKFGKGILAEPGRIRGYHDKLLVARRLRCKSVGGLVHG